MKTEQLLLGILVGIFILIAAVAGPPIFDALNESKAEKAATQAASYQDLRNTACAVERLTGRREARCHND